MVVPVQGGSGPQLSGIGSSVSGIGSGSNSDPPAPQIFADTLSTVTVANKNLVILSAGNPLLPKPSLFSYMHTVSMASVLNNQEAYQNSAAINSLTAKFYKNTILTVSFLLQIFSETQTLQKQTNQLYQEINNEINAENAQISNYDSNVHDDNTETTNMHNAGVTFNSAYALFQSQTAAYNSGLISAGEYAQDQTIFNQAQTNYNNEVASYNSYVSFRNPEINTFNSSVNSFNSAVNDNNASLAAINAERATLGLEPLPLQSALNVSPLPTTLSFANTSPPAPVTVIAIDNPSFVPLLPPYPLPTPVNVTTAVFLPLVQEYFASLSFINKGLALTSNVRTFLDFYLHTKFVVYAIPPAFASKMATGNTSNIGAGVDAGLAAISASLDPVIVERVLNKGAQNANYASLISVLKPGTIDATLAATANVLAGAAVVSANQLTQLLKDSIRGIGNDRAINDALTLGFVHNILDLVTQNTVAQALAGLTGENNLNPGENNISGINALASTVNLSLTGIALNVLSSALKLPGLGGQLLGLAGLSASDVFNLTSHGLGFNNFASNPLTQALFADQLSSQVAQAIGPQAGLSGQSLAQLQGNINNSLLQAAQLTSSFAAPEQFFNNLAQTLSSNGLTGPLAINILSQTANTFFQPAFNSSFDFRNNLQQSLIDQGFSPNDALQLASSIANVSPGATGSELLNVNSINRNLLIGNLEYNLLLTGGLTTPSDIATKVINNLLANTQEIAEATFRADLTHQLEVQGLAKEQARRIAAGTVIPLTTQNNPLLSGTTTHLLSQNQLHEELVASIKGVYSPLLNKEQAEAHAKDLANLLVGPANANAKDIHDLANPLSLTSSINTHLKDLKNLKDQTLFNNAVDSFKDYLKPSVELNAFSERLMDPGKKLFYANDVMYAQPPTTGPVKIGGTNPALEIAV